jgi:hypothetical protein
MSIQNFSVFCWPPCAAVALGSYHPYKVHGQRNPKFDRQYSGKILDIKNPSDPNHNAAVQYFSRLIAQHLSSLSDLPATDFIVVPSHTAGRGSSGLERAIDEVCRRDRRFFHRAGALARTRTIEKLSDGGDRSVQVHLDSLRYAAWPGTGPGASWSGRQRKIIVDDVSTTGHSLQAAVTVIRNVEPGAVVSCLVLGKTTHD